MDSKAYHIPVMLPECIEGLKIKADGVYVDVTYGGGGHSKAIASLLTTGKVIAFDRDADAIKNSLTTNKNLIVIHSSFSNITTELNSIGISSVDGVLADLGVSSHQFDEPQRGFAFRFDSTLDMRMDVRQQKTAATILKTYAAKELQNMFSLYGEVRNAATVAREIVTYRQHSAIATTADLKKCVSHIVPKSDENGFYARLFQALRIEVNQELKELELLLQQLPDLIKAEGRLCVMSYHSLEDRLVKNFIASGNVQGAVEQDVFGNITSKTFAAINKKPIEATEEEKINNPRSRSARLRVAERIK